MTMMTKTIPTAALARASLVAAPLLFAGPALADMTITFTGAGNAQMFEMFERFAAEYNAQADGVTVEWSSGLREVSELQQQLLRDSMVGEPLPDVVIFTGPLLRVLQERGIAVDLGPLIAADPAWAESFSSSVTAPGRVGDGTYGLAYGLSMPIVAFNDTLVAEAGGDPTQLPTDWPAIMDLATRIDALGPNTVGGFIEHDNGVAFSWLFLLESMGGAVMDEADSAFTLRGPAGEAALQLLSRFGEAGQAAADMTRDQARQAFGAGGIGVFVTMSSLLPRYEEAAADRFKVVSVPFPVADGGKLPVSALTAAMLATDAEAQRAAFDFMAFVAGPTGQEILTSSTGYAPTNRHAIEASKDLQAMLAERPNAHAYLENLDKVSGWYVVPGDNGLRIADMFMDHLQQVVMLEVSPQDALDAMQREAEAILAQQ